MYRHGILSFSITAASGQGAIELHPVSRVAESRLCRQTCPCRKLVSENVSDLMWTEYLRGTTGFS